VSARGLVAILLGAVVAEHDRLLAELGKGKITRDTPAQWNYDIDISAC